MVCLLRMASFTIYYIYKLHPYTLYLLGISGRAQPYYFGSGCNNTSLSLG